MTSFSLTAPVTDVMQASCELTLSGDPVWVESGVVGLSGRAQQAQPLGTGIEQPRPLGTSVHVPPDVQQNSKSEEEQL